MYVLINDDIDFKLEFICVFKCGDRFGVLVLVISKVEVEVGLGICLFEIRYIYIVDSIDILRYR